MFRFLIRDIRERFRFWVRQRTRSMSVAEAEEKRLFWARMYALTGLAALIYASFNVGNNDSFNRRLIWSVFHLPQEKETEYIRIEGLKKVDNFPEHVKDSFQHVTLTKGSQNENKKLDS